MLLCCMAAWLHGCNKGRTCLDANAVGLRGVDAALLAEVLSEEISRGADVGDTKVSALPVGRRVDFPFEVGATELDLTRDLQHRNDGLGELARPLQRDGVVVEATRALNLAGDHLRRGVDARALVLE